MRRTATPPGVARTIVTTALAVGLAVVVAAAGSVAPGRVRSAGPAPPYVGIWKAEASNVTKTTADPIYFEFTANGKSCAAYDTDPVYKCSAYDPSTAKADTITVHQTGVSGNPWRYRWAALPGGRLSLNSEVQLGGGQWVPLAKYTLVRAEATAKPTPTPAAVRNDRTPPKVVSVTATTRRKAPLGQIETVISCRATDNVGLKDVTIGYREPGVKAGGLTWYRLASTKDTNPKDQTWVDTFPTDKTGAYTAVCSATDKAKWSSGTTEKPFVVNPGQVKGAVTGASAQKARNYLDLLDELRKLYIESSTPWDFARIDAQVKKLQDGELSRRWAVARQSTNLRERSYNPADVNPVFTWTIEKIRGFLK